MWKALKSRAGIALMIKWNRSDQEFTFYVTDLKHIWTKVFSDQWLIEKYQELNPLFDLKSEEVVIQVQSIFEGIHEAEVDVVINEPNLLLKVERCLSDSKNPDIKTSFEMELHKAEIEKFTEMITVAMMQTIKFLEAQQKMLCNLLEKKDRELDEYQMEKGLISRSDLITEKFDPLSIVSSSDKLIVNVFEKSKSFMDIIDGQYGGAQEIVPRVEVENWNIVKKKRKYYDSKMALNSNKYSKIVYKQSNIS